MSAEPFGWGQGQIVSEGGDIDTVIDCLLNPVSGLSVCSGCSSFWPGRHALVVVAGAAGVNYRSLRRLSQETMPVPRPPRRSAAGTGMSGVLGQGLKVASNVTSEKDVVPCTMRYHGPSAG